MDAPEGPSPVHTPGRRVSFGKNSSYSSPGYEGSHRPGSFSKGPKPPHTSPGAFQRSPLDQYGALHGAGPEAVAWRQARGGLVQVRPAAGAILSPRWLASLSSLLEKLCPESESSHEAEGSLARRLEQGLSLSDEDSDEVEEGERSRRSAEAEAATSAPTPPARLRLSLRLERLALEDADIAALAAWCLERRARISLQSLWLFDNRCTDAGAEAVARLVGAFPEIEEVHLSHNRLTVHGAIALLEAVAAGIGSRAQGSASERTARRSDRNDEEDDEEGPNRAVWLRLEWNRIQLGRLCEVRLGSWGRDVSLVAARTWESLALVGKHVFFAHGKYHCAVHCAWSILR